jgi:hypothetical protein
MPGGPLAHLVPKEQELAPSLDGKPMSAMVREDPTRQDDTPE